MTHNSGYHLKPHHKFEREGRKYAADLETNDIIEINDVEWDILSRYGTQTDYQIVEALKKSIRCHLFLKVLNDWSGLVSEDNF